MYFVYGIDNRTHEEWMLLKTEDKNKAIDCAKEDYRSATKSERKKIKTEIRIYDTDNEETWTSYETVDWRITAENVNKIINVDVCADVSYHDDGGLDFMLESAGDLTDILMYVLGVDVIGYWDIYNTYLTVESNGELSDEIEFVYIPEEGNETECSYTLDEEEKEVVLERLEMEIKDEFHMSLEEMLEDADPDK